jgi:hypothetical protein
MSVVYEGHRGVEKKDGSTPESWFGYTCGHCNTKVSGAVVAVHPTMNQQVRGPPSTYWLLCPNCAEGSVKVANGNVYPGVPFGPPVSGLPPVVKSAYDEARQCMSVNAFTACELICRKILMHVAVDKGAKEGESFAAYIDYLESKEYITPR